MDADFFEELEIPKPKYNLNIGSHTHGKMTGLMLMEIESILLEEKPTIVLVQGDTNTTLAGALAASKIHIPIGHIEAGLRSYDKTMPEEINRIIVDHISDLLFVPNKNQTNILRKEGIDKSKIFVTGNTIVDAVYLAQQLLLHKPEIFQKFQLQSDQFYLLTCHRPSNTDNHENLHAILKAINQISEEENKICVFPVHPRLNSKIVEISKYSNIRPIQPISFLESIALQEKASFIFTDSGGIQEESCILRKRCLVLRTNTERPEALKVGGAELLETITTEHILQKYNYLKNKTVNWYNPFGDGKSAQTIINIILNCI